MEALYFGNAKGGLNHGGAGAGPWIMADMEQALWGADKIDSEEPPINHAFVTAMIKGDVSTNAPGGHWAIKVCFSCRNSLHCFVQVRCRLLFMARQRSKYMCLESIHACN